MRRVLGIDVGKKKTGVAVGQSISATATPLAILHKSANQLQAQDFALWIREWRINEIVIGLPTLADGKPHALAPSILRLQRQLANDFSLPCHTVSEYLSSHEARARAGGKKWIDDYAAAILVEDYLSQ